MKRLIGILLAVALLVSCLAVSTAAYSVFEPDTMTPEQAIAEHELLWEEEVDTNTYYFLMPDGTNGEMGDDEESGFLGQYAPKWYNQVSNVAGIYWWDSGVADPPAWAGYIATKEEAPRVFSATVPKAVTGIIWNNGVDGGMNAELDIYYLAAQTVNIGSEYYDPGESDLYPDGTESFDGMIYVIDPDKVSINDYSKKQTCGGEWYYYYGNGCYGLTPEEGTCERDDHHDADGNHVIPEPTPEPPTESHTDAPTEAPTDEPTGEDPTDPTEYPTDVPTAVPTGEVPSDPPTEPVDFLLGDVDGDGKVSVLDAAYIQKFKASLIELTEEQLLIADVDGDGQVSVLDAAYIQQLKANIIDKLPAAK